MPAAVSPARRPTPTSADPDRWHEITVHGLSLCWRASGLQTGSRFWTPWTPPQATPESGPESGPESAAAAPPRVLISPTAAPPPHGWPTLEPPRAASEGVVVATCPAGEARYLLSYPDMPHPGGPVFQVEADRVLIHGGDDTAPEELSWFLVGPVLSFLLAVRGAAVFHASAVRFAGADGQGVAAAFIGPSGAGKSTLVAAFAGRGRPGVSDDLLVLKGDAELKGDAVLEGDAALESDTLRHRQHPGWRVHPGAPRRLLWPDSARHLGTGTGTGTGDGDGGAYRWDKHDVAASTWVRRRPLSLGRLFYLRPAPASAQPAVRPMPARQATAALLGNLRLAWLAGRRRRRDLDVVTRLVDRGGVDELVVPRDFRRLPAVLNLVEERLARLGPAWSAAAPATEAPSDGAPPVAEPPR